MPSRAFELFQVIEANPILVLQSFAETHHIETEFLEFKGGTIDNRGAREYWGKALSGFANTEGGVLVFGIDCRKIDHPDLPGTQIDAAGSVSHVRNTVQLHELLKRAQLEAVQDALSGVEIRIHPLDTGSPEGFVVCYVPEGPDKPYRATRDTVYYQRVQDNFCTISHPLLRSLFYPKTRAILDVEARVESIIGGCRLSFFLRNTGTATAGDMAVSIHTEFPMGMAPASSRWQRAGGDNGPTDTPWRFSTDKPLHPEQSAVLCTSEVTDALIASQRVFRLPTEPLASLRFTFYVRDQVPQVLLLDIGKDDIRGGKTLISRAATMPTEALP